MLRLGTSIRTGVVSASIVMLEQLGSYPRANGLALALREIGRVERTLFTLDWIEQPNSVAAPPANSTGRSGKCLKRAIFFHRIGRIRDHALQPKPSGERAEPRRRCHRPVEHDLPASRPDASRQPRPAGPAGPAATPITAQLAYQSHRRLPPDRSRYAIHRAQTASPDARRAGTAKP